ncbi:hypothetical protein BK809_0004968 [Diplodia seriata]|uniref:Uncharacterized protein n=1 Tax=Diplodia seriata TaxID=420778 RepID=A0A1S8B7Q7_9PEZI|nr:hypothetical protein BK809_0004968 [Diplodia seriata]
MTAVLYLTFRLRGLPRTYVDESSVQQLIKTLFSIQPAGVTVFSLANSPVDSETRVATLSFRRVPLELCDNSMGQWTFDHPPYDDAQNKATTRKYQLVFDTHFRGLTPLHRQPDFGCSVEYGFETSSGTTSLLLTPAISVLAISGLGGHAFGSFKVRAGPFMWLRDALPYNLPQARIFIYGFDTQLPNSQSFQSLDDLGKGFIDLALEAITTAQTVRIPIITNKVSRYSHG